MKYVKLDKLCDITMGQSPDSSSYNDKGIGLPFFQGKSEFGKIYPTAKMYCTEPKKTAQPLDILMSVRAPVGDVNISNIDCCIGRGLCSIRCKNNINYKYIYYYLLTQKKVLESQSTGSTFKAINKSIVSELEIPLQDLDAQHKIVEVLEKAQGLIDKRKEQIELLDELIQSRFLEMFGNPVTNSKNLSVKNFEEVIVLKRGYDLPTYKRDESGAYNVWGSNGILSKHNEYKVNTEGVITGRSGSLGNVYYTKEPYWPLNTTLFSKDTCGNNIVYLTYLLRFYDLKRFSNGTGVPTLNRNLLNGEKIIDVPLELQEEFADFVEKVNDIKIVLNKSLEQLNNNFDSLISRAFKGELF